MVFSNKWNSTDWQFATNVYKWGCESTMKGLNQRIKSETNNYNLLKNSIKPELHFMMPAIITAFDPLTQMVNAKPATTLRLIDNYGVAQYLDYPELIDVPLIFAGGPGLYLTFPISIGDECLVFFADNDISTWLQNGAFNKDTMEVVPQDPEVIRFHSLSDAFALVGVNSIPNVLLNYNTVSPEIRNRDGTAKIVFGISGDILISGKSVITEETG